MIHGSFDFTVFISVVFLSVYYISACVAFALFSGSLNNKCRTTTRETGGGKEGGTTKIATYNN